MRWPSIHAPYCRALLWSLLWALLLAVHLPALLTHMRAASDPDRFTDDATQHVAPYLRYMDDGPRGQDLSADYFEACHPLGYRVLYRTWAACGDPRDLSRRLPYLLLPLFVAGMAWAGYSLAGAPGAIAAAWLCLSTDLFFPRMVGGLPRSFGYPVLALGLAAQLAGRWRWAAAAIPFAAATYPAAAVPLGIALAVNRLAPLAFNRTNRQAWIRRLLELTAVAVLAALVVLPTLIATRPYGPSIGPRDLTDFPEAQAGGRLGPADRVDFAQPAHQALVEALPRVLRHLTQPWHPGAGPWLRRHSLWFYGALHLLTAAGCLLALRRNVPARRLVVFLGAALLSYGAARALVPHFFLPERHLAYALPIAAVLILISALWGWPALATGARRRWLAPLLVAGVPLLLAACFGGTIALRAGLPPGTKGQEGLGHFLAALPADAHIAGWPKVLDRLRYRCARRMLATHETNLPYHAAYTLAMRERVRAVLQAMYATRWEQAQALHTHHAVTHLVILRDHLHLPPKTYPPYGDQLVGALTGYALEQSLWVRLASQSVYADEHYLVFELAQLDAHDGSL